MAEQRNQGESLGGEYMIQDRDHSVESGKSSRRAGRQSEQSQNSDRQQGDKQDHSAQQGATRNRKSR